MAQLFQEFDPPRKWCEKIPGVLSPTGCRKQRMCLGLFALRSSAGILNGVNCLHVDMQGTGSAVFESKMKELDRLVGFGLIKRHKVDHCGRHHEKHANGEITISMKS